MVYAPYETLQNLRTVNGIPPAGEDDPSLEGILLAASHTIDRYCGRTFQLPEVTASARTYAAPMSAELRVEDFVELTSVAVDGVTLVATSYEARPLNLTDLRPSRDRLVCLYSYLDYSEPVNWSTIGRLVTVTARWGWALDVPDEVREVCRIMAARLWNREKAGYANEHGTTQGGLSIVQSPRATLDRDCIDLLKPFRRQRAAASINIGQGSPPHGLSGWELLMG